MISSKFKYSCIEILIFPYKKRKKKKKKIAKNEANFKNDKKHLKVKNYRTLKKFVYFDRQADYFFFQIYVAPHRLDYFKALYYYIEKLALIFYCVSFHNQ